MRLSSGLTGRKGLGHCVKYVTLEENCKASSGYCVSVPYLSFNPSSMTNASMTADVIQKKSRLTGQDVAVGTGWFFTEC
jgi:hypothetical protein